MIYDLSNPLHRKQFTARANRMLKKGGVASLSEECTRSPGQNRYLHVLCRIMATETGVSEQYAKDVYFKQLANIDMFVVETEDPITGTRVQTLRSTTTLSKDEMRRAITNFRHWAADNGYYLPEADQDDDGRLVFASERDEQAYRQAVVETGRVADAFGN